MGWARAPAKNSASAAKRSLVLGLEAIPMAKSLGARKHVTALIESLPANQRKQLGYELLAEARLKQDAIACAVAELNENLRELKTMDDPNIHFPVMNIERALAFLIEINEKELARQWFGKVASSAKSWKCVIRGWVTSAVLTTFVPIVTKLEGKAAAKELARLSFEVSVHHHHVDFDPTWG